MADMYLVTHSDMTGVAEEIRAKSGKTDALTFPDGWKEAIEGITGGGEGVPEGYVTVTFHYTDQEGQKEFSRLVMVGDNCPDPLVQERIDTPTKESTAQYDYTFNGWATADGGAADSTALQNITEDRVLYAAFAESVIKYIVTYYDEDGVTVLHTEQVAYGGSSTYKYEKIGYKFNGWTPTPTNVTTDLDCYGSWEENLEIADDWDTIIAAAEDGTYATKYKIGQYKPLDLGAEGVIRMQYVYSSKNDTTTASGYKPDFTFDDDVKTSMTFVAMDLLANKKKLNETEFSGSDYGWSTSTLYTYLQDTIKPLMPNNVLTAIKTVRKFTYEYVSRNRSATQTAHDLWIPSYKEMFGNVTGAETSGATYANYFTSNTLRKRMCAGTTQYTYYWLRTLSRSTDKAYHVSSTGSYATSQPQYNEGVLLGFCI